LRERNTIITARMTANTYMPTCTSESAVPALNAALAPGQLNQWVSALFIRKANVQNVTVHEKMRQPVPRGVTCIDTSLTIVSCPWITSPGDG
jgi:hypothetical protein